MPLPFFLSYSHNQRTHNPPLHSYMSHTRPTSTSSSNFQVIFNNALKAYERRTKKDLLAHPLAAQLQDCNSHSSILIVLQQQVQELDQSQTSDERFDQMVGSNCEGSLYLIGDPRRRCQPGIPRDIKVSEIWILILILQVFSPAKTIFAGIGVLLSVCILLNTIVRTIVIRMALRQPRMFVRTKTHFLRCSSA